MNSRAIVFILGAFCTIRRRSARGTKETIALARQVQRDKSMSGPQKKNEHTSEKLSRKLASIIHEFSDKEPELVSLIFLGNLSRYSRQLVSSIAKRLTR